MPNAGLFEAVRIHAPLGSIVNPRPPAAVGARSITCQKVCGAIFGAFREFGDIVMRDETGKETGTFVTGREMKIEIHYRAKRRIEKPVFGFSIKTGNGFFIYGTNTQIMNVPIDFVEGDGVVTLSIEPLRLMEGKYFLSLAIHNQDHSVQYHRREDWHPFAVKNPTSSHGVVHLDCRWSHQP